MEYSLLRITELYPWFIESVYVSNCRLSKLSFKEQTEFLTKNSVEISSLYVKEFQKMGINAQELITNAHAAQKQWCKENNVSSKISLENLTLKQINTIKPTVVWIDSTSLINKDFINSVRNHCPSVKLVVGHICAPFNKQVENGLRALDAVFTCTPCIQEKLNSKEIKNVYLVYHAFSPQIIEMVNKNNVAFSENDFVFTGSLYTGYGLHKTRIEYLEAMIANGVNVSIYGNLESRSAVLKKQGMNYLISTINKLGLKKLIDKSPLLSRYRNYGETKISYYSKRLIKATKPPVFGLDMYRVLKQSKICFNIHGDIAGSCAGNLRLFEATGIGTCLLTDYKQNLNQLFEIEKEIVTYKNLSDCIEKVNFLLNNPKQRLEIAAAGQKRVLASHTVAHRVEQVNNLISNLLK